MFEDPGALMTEQQKINIAEAQIIPIELYQNRIQLFGVSNEYL